MVAEREDVSPWYRQPMVWMLIAIPATSVLMGGVMIHLAATTDDGLVVDDYYKNGLEINRSLTRDRAAARLGMIAELTLEPEREGVDLVLSAKMDFPAPAAVRLGMYHATRQGFDQVLLLRRAPDGVYTGRLAALAAGRWNVQINGEHWRLNGSLFAPGQQFVRILSDSTVAQ